MGKLRVFSKRLAWFIGMPLILCSSLYCFFSNQLVLDFFPFLLGCSFCFPVVIFVIEDMHVNTYQARLIEFRKMTRAEFLEVGDQLNMPVCLSTMATIRDVYREVYKEKFGRDCFF